MRSSPPTAPYELFVGVDSAAATATVSWQVSKLKPGKPVTIRQTPEGFSSLHHQLMNTKARLFSIL
jgi:ferredoxin-NADP reductase